MARRFFFGLAGPPVAAKPNFAANRRLMTSVFFSPGEEGFVNGLPYSYCPGSVRQVAQISKEANSSSWSFCKHSVAFGYLASYFRRCALRSLQSACCRLLCTLYIPNAKNINCPIVKSFPFFTQRLPIRHRRFIVQRTVWSDSVADSSPQGGFGSSPVYWFSLTLSFDKLELAT